MTIPGRYDCVAPKCDYVGKNMFDLLLHVQRCHRQILLSNANGAVHAIQLSMPWSWCFCGKPVSVLCLEEYARSMPREEVDASQLEEADQMRHDLAMWYGIERETNQSREALVSICEHIIIEGGLAKHWQKILANSVMDRLSTKR